MQNAVPIYIFALLWFAEDQKEKAHSKLEK